MDLLNSFYNSFNTNVLKQTNKYKLVFTSYKELKDNYNIQNWRKNRSADQYRVNEIYNNYLETNIDLLPGILYLWKSNNIYWIYDGLHRYEALKKLDNDNVNILIYINLTTDENSIISEFININKSVPLPHLYIEEYNANKIFICQNVAETLCKNYPNFVSTSRRPRNNNFNRDSLIEFISTFDINFTIDGLHNIIYNLLMELNKKAKEKHIKVPTKCIKYDFYLFYIPNDDIKEYIEQKVNELIV
jgi:hypothetical protein